MMLLVVMNQGAGAKGATRLLDDKRQPENQTRIRINTNTGLRFKKHRPKV